MFLLNLRLIKSAVSGSMSIKGAPLFSLDTIILLRGTEKRPMPKAFKKASLAAKNPAAFWKALASFLIFAAFIAARSFSEKTLD